MIDVKSALLRRRGQIQDIGLILLSLAIAGLFVFEIDVFRAEGSLTPHQELIELDEVLILTSLLMAAVLFYVWRRAADFARETRRRAAAEKEVLTLALQDPLTGLPNRRQFDDELRQALEALPTAPEAHAVFMLDLNGFKQINDIHGHPTGDQTLIHVGARLLRAVRDGDLVARLGGDEFAVIARNVAGAEGATTIGLRILESLAPPVVIGPNRHAVGAAIGVALTPHDGDTAEDLIRKADVALYRAKAERASTLRFFEVAMDARLLERDALRQALLDDLEADRFEVRFQPRVSQTGEVVAFEAQPQWPRDGYAPLPPERFLSIAEEAAALSPLSRALFQKACAQTGNWPRSVRLSFPLPAALLSSPAFGLTILSLLSKTGLSPSRLDLEIDEGALTRDADGAMAMLAPLRGAGVRLIASRFGTGYSNLQNFRRLKLDGVKIDSSFISAMGSDRGAAVMVRALIGVGQGLDLDVIADGVVSPLQSAALAAEGCDLAQGKLYGDALTATEALTLVLQHPARRRLA